MYKNELKRTFRSFIFLLVSICLSLSLISQLSADDYNIVEPQKGAQNYGRRITYDLGYIVTNLVKDLRNSIDNNTFITYPLGIIKVKKLNPSELELLEGILGSIDGGIPERTYLETQLDKIDSIIGSGSFFSRKRYIQHYGLKEISYEDAIKDYELMKSAGLDTAFARYFSDYAGVFLSLFSWFIPLFMWNKDRYEGISDLLSVKSFSSVGFILSRILTMSIALMMVLIAIYAFFEVKILRTLGGTYLNPIRSFIIVFLWNFPVILFVMTLASLIMIVTNNIVYGFAGPILSLMSGMTGSSTILYDINLSLLLRFNSIGNEQYFMENLRTFIIGRTMWIGISLLLILIASLIFDLRRRGIYVPGKIRSPKERA